jgi:peptidyl-dipeptidase Dcp
MASMRKHLVVGAGAAALLLGACATSQHTPTPSPTMSAEAENPLLARWTGPYGGVPAFDKARLEHFRPALQAAMDEYRAEIDAIAQNPEPPTFENTLEALERAGRTYADVRTVYWIWSSTLSSPEFQAVERELAPKMAALSDEVTQNEKLFERVAAVYESPRKSELTAEQQRLAWLYHRNFVRAGANLEGPAKQRMAQINQRLASLFTSFGQNVLGEEEHYTVVLESEADLAGLPDSVVASAAAAAQARGLKGKWVIHNTRSAMEPFLTYSARRDLREQVWRNYVNRGDNGDERDNKQIISEILKLRAERASLLGYKTHAHWRLEDAMAATPERAMALLQAVWTPAVARVREEVADMQAVADKEGAKIKIEPWDYRFYAEKVRKAKYDLDQNEVKPYMQLEKLREGMFWVAGELFGFTFHAIDEVPVYHPDVRVWEVKNKQTGQHVGLFYFDPYARQGKRSGAWMNAYRRQHRLEGEVPTLVSNNSNFMKGAENEAVLISWDDASTLFHEFGHALHGLSSNVTYPGLSGTLVARDYVEFPSQLLEHWLETPEVLGRFALHHQTGEPIPQTLVQKIQKASTFNQGFATVEYLASALVDLKLHLAGAQDIDAAAFERDTLQGLGMPKEIVMRHRTPQFMHVFGSDGYSAGYYSYLWADTLTADAFEAFMEGAGPWDTEVAGRLRQHVFSTGNTLDPAQGYRAFRGKDPGIDALMRKRGFPVVPTKATPARSAPRKKQ